MKLGSGAKVLIGAGVGLILLRTIGQNIIDGKVFDAALRSTNRTELAQVVAYFRSKGQHTKADVIQARLDNLPR